MAVPMKALVLFGGVAVWLGEVLHIVGLGSTYWIKADNGNEGLFQVCVEGVCASISNPPDELKAVQAMVCLGLVSGFAAVVLSIVVVVQRSTNRSVTKMLAVLCLVAGIVAVVFILIGVIVYVKKIYDPILDAAHGNADLKLGYSFALCIVGGVLMFIGSMMVIIGGVSTSNSGEYSSLIGNR